MAKTPNEQFADKALKLHKELNNLRDEAYQKGLRQQGEILRDAGRGLDRIGEYNRAEAPER
jgi:hypothetical protein